MAPNNTFEPVDIVDEQDQVLYQSTKAVAHEKGLLHRTVIAELIDSQGNWTLVKQSASRQDSGQFVSPVGGHVGAGESADQALIREAIEEIGITPTKYQFIGKKIYNRQVIGRQENHYFIVYEIYSDETPVLNHESVEYKKYTKEEIYRLIKSNPDQFGAAFHFVFHNFFN